MGILAAMENSQGLATREKIAHLAGLMRSHAGAAPGPEPVAEVLSGVLDVLGDLADEVASVRSGAQTLTGRVRALREGLAELSDEVLLGEIGPGHGVVIRCADCGQAMEVAIADLDDDQVELICPACGHVVHNFDAGFDYDEDQDELIEREPE